MCWPRASVQATLDAIGKRMHLQNRIAGSVLSIGGQLGIPYKRPEGGATQQRQSQRVRHLHPRHAHWSLLALPPLDMAQHVVHRQLRRAQGQRRDHGLRGEPLREEHQLRSTSFAPHKWRKRNTGCGGSPIPVALIAARLFPSIQTVRTR